jgi:hypothetical protein
LADGHIRVLRLDRVDESHTLHWNMSNAVLDNAAEYDAISYTWNNETPTVPIKCNGQILLVTSSLHEALQMLHLEGDSRLLWADAVCIKSGR